MADLIELCTIQSITRILSLIQPRMDPSTPLRLQFSMYAGETQATFGPTRAALDELGSYASYADWIAAQIALDASLHREFLRERVHPLMSHMLRRL